MVRPVTYLVYRGLQILPILDRADLGLACFDYLTHRWSFFSSSLKNFRAAKSRKTISPSKRDAPMPSFTSGELNVCFIHKIAAGMQRCRKRFIWRCLLQSWHQADPEKILKIRKCTITSGQNSVYYLRCSTFSMRS